jgi:hypothetical protein
MWCQRFGQAGQALDVVGWRESIYVRQHQADALRHRLKTIEAQQRIEPDQAAAGLVQPSLV